MNTPKPTDSAENEIVNIGGFNWRCKIGSRYVYLHQPSRPTLEQFKNESFSRNPHSTEANTLRDRRAAKRGRKILDSAPDWFGCGRMITTESWNRFLAARKAYYAKQDSQLSS